METTAATTTEGLINNFELKKLCRMCLKKETILKSMFYCSVGDFSYAEIYEQCTGFNISKDISPSCCTSICGRCENDLLFVFDFKQKVQESEGRLEKLLLLHSSSEQIQRDQFLGIDDSFLDYHIESLDELEKSFSECKFKSLINTVKCTTCLDNCETEKAINGLNSSHDPYTILCECGALLSTRSNFLAHYAQMHDKKSIRSGDEQKMRMHCNNNNLKVVNGNECHLDDEHEGGGKSIWRCLTCSLGFMREDSLRRHLASAHVHEGCEFTQESEFEISTESDLECSKAAMALGSRKKTACPICGEQFNHRSTKISHMVRNHPDDTRKALECTYVGCGYSTLKRDRYQAHIDKHENPDKTYHCSVCSQEFNSFNTMNLHRAKHSTSSLTFLCSFCDKIFLDKRNYNRHTRLHTRENLFYCTKCHRGFNRKEHLSNHLRRKNECDKDATSV